MRFYTYIASLLFVLSVLGQVSGLKTSYIAGNPVSFHYKTAEQDVQLLVLHSYGTQILNGQSEDDGLRFALPELIIQKKGKVVLQLIAEEEVVWKKRVDILARKDGKTTVEAYCGPKHLVVNKSDYSMITATSLDIYDNSFPKGTIINVSSIINEKLEIQEVKSNGLLAFDRIYAPTNSGYGAVYAGYEAASSKEFRLDFYSNEPQTFTIDVSRQHGYADGLQLISIQTNTITDRFGNKMENGTLVTFVINDSEGRKTVAQASTIEGKATIQLPAPSFATKWDIQAEIASYASSNRVELSFQQSLSEIPIEASPKALFVGPLKSYMGQLVKEGLPVKITLQNEKRTATYTIATEQGMAVLDYRQQLLRVGSYDATVEVGGISRKVKLEVGYE